MKRINAIFFAATAAALSLASCSQENLAPAEKPQGELVTVHFGAESFIASTKATLTTEDEKTFKSAWENGDVLSVEYMNDNGAGTVDATWQSSLKSFDAALPPYTGTWTYDAVYPAPASDRTIDFGSSRTQKGNVYNCMYDLMSGSAVAENAAEGKDDKGNDIIFEMDRQTAIAYFHLKTSGLDEDVVSATLSVEGDNAYIATKSAKLTEYAKGYELAADATNGLKKITIKFEGAAPKATDLKLWFNVLPTEYTSMKLEVETTGHKLTLNNGNSSKYEVANLYKVVKEIPVDKWVAKTAPVDTKELVFDFKSSFPTGWPTDSKNAEAGTYDYTIDGVAYSFIHGSGIYCGGITPNSGYLFITKNSTLGLPSIKGYRLEKVIGTLNDSGSPSIKSVISITDGTDVVSGGVGQTWSKKGADYTYTLSGTEENTVYYMSVTAANCQMMNLKLYYEVAAPSVQTCATPVITLSGALASVTCATKDAIIHYTVDGTDPTAASPVYTAAVTLTDGQTIKAIAVKDGMKDSAVASKKYTSSSTSEELLTYVSTFTDKDLNTTEKVITWKSSISANSFETASPSRGLQFGSGKGEFTITGTGHSSKVKKIAVVISTNGTGNTISATIGSVSIGSQVSLTKANNYEIVFESATALSGDIVFNVNDTNKSVYFKSIMVNPEN